MSMEKMKKVIPQVNTGTLSKNLLGREARNKKKIRERDLTNHHNKQKPFMILSMYIKLYIYLLYVDRH